MDPQESARLNRRRQYTIAWLVFIVVVAPPLVVGAMFGAKAAVWFLGPWAFPIVLTLCRAKRELGMPIEQYTARLAAAEAAEHERREAAAASKRLELELRLEGIRDMDGTEFELFVADVLRGLGYMVTRLGAGDQGVDLIAARDGERVAVQCKNCARAGGNRPVQKVSTGARHHRCSAAWVVAPAGFTKGARDLARSVGVSLYDARDLRAWIRRV